MTTRKSKIKNLQFLKLGGSLITDKTSPQTPRREVLQNLAGEIALACRENPGLKLVIGHGSGSYGHIPAQKYGTRNGVHTHDDWRGFAEVWRAAQALDRLVIDSLAEADLPVIAFSPVANVMASDGKVLIWDLAPLQNALEQGLIPVVYGDVVFDKVRGGTILSTEDLFTYLNAQLQPERILLAGIEAGVWRDYPLCHDLVDIITPGSYAMILPALGGSAATDVTGGMASKIGLCLKWVQETPGLQVLVFPGETPGNLMKALSGTIVGTQIRRD